jgi:sulfur transfer protein SufE
LEKASDTNSKLIKTQEFFDLITSISQNSNPLQNTDYTVASINQGCRTSVFIVLEQEINQIILYSANTVSYSNDRIATYKNI